LRGWGGRGGVGCLFRVWYGNAGERRGVNMRGDGRARLKARPPEGGRYRAARRVSGEGVIAEGLAQVGEAVDIAGAEYKGTA